MTTCWPCEDSTLHVHTKGPCSGWPYPKDHHRDLKYLYATTAAAPVLGWLHEGRRAVSEPTTAKQIGGTHARLSDGTAWPLPDMEDDGLRWVLTYGEPSRSDMIRAASIIGAYGYLLTETTTQRRAQIVRDVRHVLATRPSQDAAGDAGDWQCGVCNASRDEHAVGEKDGLIRHAFEPILTPGDAGRET